MVVEERGAGTRVGRAAAGREVFVADALLTAMEYDVALLGLEQFVSRHRVRERGASLRLSKGDLATTGVVVGVLVLTPTAWVHFGAVVGMTFVGAVLLLAAVAWFSATE